MPIWDTPREITSPMVHRLNAYWRARKEADRLPLRDAFDPADLRDILANIVIVDFARQDPPETAPFVRYRLVGTKVVEMSRYDFTGRTLSEMVFQAGEADIWPNAYARIAETGTPVYGRVEIPIEDTANRIVREEFGIFPLSHTGARIDQCIAVEDYGPHDPGLDPARLRPMRVRADAEG